MHDVPMDGVATRVFLQPIAASSILGLFGFAELLPLFTFKKEANKPGARPIELEWAEPGVKMGQ